MSVYDAVHIRSLLLRDKRFLLDLFVNNIYQNRKLILGASQSHLNTVLKILHLIANNQIRIDEEDFEALKKSKKANVLKTKIKSKEDFLYFLTSAEPKRRFLLQFIAVFKILLKPIFEEDY